MLRAKLSLKSGCLHRSVLCRRCPTISKSTSTLNPTPNPRKVIFSGIQPTGVPHIGNYLGALRSWVTMQNSSSPQDTTLIFSVVGWHALTLPQDPARLREARDDMFATLLAIGLDPGRCIIFHQDENPDHTELAWLLNCITPFGKLRRMTTWKSRLAVSRNANDESEVDESMLNAGLFTYPVLQAADILAYRATHVPVGDDQQQHLELCRDLAEILNRSASVNGNDNANNDSLFPLPETVFNPSRRILSLKDPSSKMSKSARDPNSRILLTDPPSAIQSKIRSAVTDSIPFISYDPVSRPGTSNILTILAGCLEEDVLEVAERYKNKGHGELKRDVGEAVEETLRGPREEFVRVRGDGGYLREVAQRGVERAREISGRTLEDVRRVFGLRR